MSGERSVVAMVRGVLWLWREGCCECGERIVAVCVRSVICMVRGVLCGERSVVAMVRGVLWL